MYSTFLSFLNAETLQVMEINLYWWQEYPHFSIVAADDLVMQVANASAACY